MDKSRSTNNIYAVDNDKINNRDMKKLILFLSIIFIGQIHAQDTTNPSKHATSTEASSYVQVRQRTWNILGIVCYRCKPKGFESSDFMLFQMKKQGYKLISSHTYAPVGFLIFCSKTVFVFDKNE